MKTRRSTLRLAGWMLGGCALPLVVLHAGRLRPPSLPEFQTLQPRFVDVPHSLDWSRDGSSIAAVGPVLIRDKRQLALRFWKRRGEKFELARTIALPDREPIETLQFVPDAKGASVRVMSVGGGAVHVWNGESGKCEKTIAPFTRDHWGKNKLVLSARLSPDGKSLACGEALPVLTGVSRGRVTLRGWDGQVQVLGGGSMGPVRALAWSHDGSLLAAGGQNGDVAIYEMPSGRFLRRWKATPRTGHITKTYEDGRREVTITHGEVQALAFVPRSSVLLTATGMDTLAARDVRSGLPVEAPMSNAGGWAMCVSESGVLARESTLDLEMRRLSSPDKRQSALDSDRVVMAPGHTYQIPNSDSALAFSPDERQILARGSDGALVLWRVDL